MHNTSSSDTNFQPKYGKVLGSRECGLMTQGEWDQRMECNTERDKTIPYIDDRSTKKLVLESQQACAEETARTDGANHWVYDWGNKMCKIKNYGGSASGVSAVNQIKGNRRCGFMSQEQWDRRIVSECERYYDVGSNSQHVKALNVTSQQACAEETARTEGMTASGFWVYNWKTTECRIIANGYTIAVTNSTEMVGRKECGLLNQGQWDSVMANDCQREPGTNFVYGQNTIRSQSVNDEESCASLAANTEGGLFWGFDTKALMCNVVNSNDTKHTSSDWVTGNRQCGFQSSSNQEQTLPKLTSEEVKKLGKHLTKPKNCPSSQSTPNHEGQKDETGALQTPPIIDVFLNPNRKDELEEMLRSSEQKETGELPKVSRVLTFFQIKYTVCPCPQTNLGMR